MWTEKFDAFDVDGQLDSIVPKAYQLLVYVEVYLEAFRTILSTLSVT